MKRIYFLLAILAAIFLSLSQTSGAQTGSNSPSNSVHSRVQVQPFAQHPLSFEANRGQMPGPVKFLAHGANYSLFLTPKEAVIALRKPVAKSRRAPDSDIIPQPAMATAAIVRMKLAGGKKNPAMTGVGELSARSNYFIGNDPKKWQTGITNFSQVRYKNVYPGVDLLYYGNDQRLEFDFEVAPGADPLAITMNFEGTDKLEVGAAGDLVLQAGGRQFSLQAPQLYQLVHGSRKNIAGHYRLLGSNQVGFDIASHDAKNRLVIDPTLVYSTYLGGNGDDEAKGIAVDSLGNAYVMGITSSTDFPTTVGALKTTCGTDTKCNFTYDFFVSKFTPAGKLIYSTYLGGSNTEYINFISNDIAVDSTGSAYITGSTLSLDYPTTRGSFDPTGGVLRPAAVVTKLDPTGSTLLYSTYLRGSVGFGTEGRGIAVDSGGNAYVTGDTNSNDFPIVGGFQTLRQGGRDAFVAKLNPLGSALVYSSFLGGGGRDQALSIAVDPLGSAYVTGLTGSLDFPKLNAAETLKGGGVSKTSDGGLTWNLGNAGMGTQSVRALVLDPKARLTLYAGTNGGAGVYKSTDGGTTWIASGTGIANTLVRALAIDPVTTTTLYAGTNGGGVFKTSDGGKTWAAVNSGLTDLQIFSLAVDRLAPSTIYAGGANSGVFKSTNGGATWTGSSSGLRFLFIDTVAVDPMDSRQVYVGTPGGVSISSDGGATWVTPSNLLNSQFQEVTSLAINPSNTSVLYAESLGGFGFNNNPDVFKSNNRGLTWVPANANLNFGGSGGLAIDPSAPDTVYVGDSGFVFGGEISRSTDAGITWKRIDNGLVNRLVMVIALDPSAPGVVYVGSDFFQGFVSKINPSGSALVYSTYIAGGSSVVGHSVVADSSGNAYVAGHTSSSDFVASSGAFQTNFKGVLIDAWIRKYSPSGAVLYSTFLAGAQGSQVARAIAIDGSGNAFVTGETDSVDFPLVNSLQQPLGTVIPASVGFLGSTVFVSELNATGGGLLFSTIFGGGFDKQDVPSGIALDSFNNILVSGLTSAGEFPTFNAQQAIRGTQQPDAFVFKISQAPPSSNPVPTVNTVTDALLDRSGALLGLIAVGGTNFVTSSVAQVNGIPVFTRFVNTSRLIAALPAPLLASGALAFGFDLAVMNPAPGGGLSNAIHVIFGATTLKALGMTTRELGGGAITLPLYGTNFAPGVVAQWNGQSRATTFVSSTEVDAAIPASDLATAGIAQVTLTDPGSRLTSKALPFAVTDFAVAGDSGQLTVLSGASATAKISLTSQFGAFNRAVNLSCSGLPQFAQCAFAQNTLTPGSGGASTTLTISTGTPKVAANSAPTTLAAQPPGGSLAAFWLLLPAVIWMGAGSTHARRKTRRLARIKTLLAMGLLGLLFAGIAMTLTGCGGGSSFVPPPAPQTNSTPPGSYNITVTATSDTVVHAVQVNLVVR